MSDVVASFHAHNIPATREAIDAALVVAVERIGPVAGGSALPGLPAAEAEILDSVGVAAASDDAVTRQALATTTRFAALIVGGLRTMEVAALLGVTTGRVRQKLLDAELYAIDDPSGRGHLFPRFQFEHGRPLPGLGAVLAALPAGVHPLAVESFFVEPNPDLALEGDPVPVAVPVDEPTLEQAREMLERAGYSIVLPASEILGGPAAQEADVVLSPRQWLASGFDPAAAAVLAAEL